MFFTDFARRPIDETNPSGVNPNNLEEFDEIKRQINNLNKVTGRVSWKTVQSLSKKVLTSHSKDFRCSCYYTVAATHNEGLKGLVEGLNSLLDLSVVYWFTAFPDHSKSNARIGAVEWMVENTEKRIKKESVTQDELPLIEAAHQICLKIEEELRLHFGIKAPSLGRIRRILKQWIEDLKEQQVRELERLEKKKEKQTISTPVPPQGGIKVDIQPPTPPAHVTKVEQPSEEPKSSKAAIYSLVALLLIALASHFIYKQQTYITLQTRIDTASIYELESVVKSLSYENQAYSEKLRSSVVHRLDTLLKNWALDPLKVSQVNTIELLTDELVSLYPDSSSALMLRDNFKKQRGQFEQDFQTLMNRFNSARTVFANVKAKGSDKYSTKAYEYSNSLFPLLGRIEYAEKQSKQVELNRSLLLLNTYLYKINQVQASVDSIKNN
ncbi:type VI secretion protein [Vibrio sp. T187]|uniref:type VI secretion system ImpA family N-terminal domain-containing protein n=1 Tax=Vibrio TaxID=662 RepID=UPI0010C9A7FC|nr:MULTISPECIES: type VI secretion system ImpA family N-terminal domain-containing protein [Vibrio]MBW3698152.1 type VI secretion protein [Vibrio sp. T187]